MLTDNYKEERQHEHKGTAVRTLTCKCKCESIKVGRKLNVLLLKTWILVRQTILIRNTLFNGYAEFFKPC